MRGIEAFPYPADEPETVRQLGRSLHDSGLALDDTSTRMEEGSNAIRTRWRSTAGDRTAFGAEVATGFTILTAACLQGAAKDVGRYATALDDARAAIDHLRASYDAAWAIHEAEIATLEASDLPGPARSWARDEAEAGHSVRLSDLHHEYEEVLATLGSVAMDVGSRLMVVAGAVSPVPESCDPQLARAGVLEHLTFMAPSAGTTVQHMGDMVLVDTGDGDDEVRVHEDPGTGGLIVTVNGRRHGVSTHDAADVVVRTNGGHDSIVVGPGVPLRLTLISNEGEDTITGARGRELILAGVDDDLVEGGGGDDVIVAGDGNDVVIAGPGEDGDDTIHGNAGDDLIDAGGGDDTIDGEGGKDMVMGGDGNDTIDGGLDDDTIDGGQGDDVVLATWNGDTDGHDTIDGGSGADRIAAGGGDDEIRGGEGNDTIDSGAGHDTIDGGSGADRIAAGDGNDVMLGGDGADTIDAGAGGDYVDSGAGRDQIAGGRGNDVIYAGADADSVDGGAGDDYIDGYTGGDEIAGGAGDDVVSGGGGHDALRGDGGDDVVYSGAGRDVVIDRDGRNVVHHQGEDDVTVNVHSRQVVVEVVRMPDNIVVEGTPAFRARVQADLDTLASSPTGRQMLDAIAEWTPGQDRRLGHSHTLTIRETPSSAMQSVPDDLTEFTGSSDVLVGYNPVERHPGTEVTPVFTLQHELAHAYNGMSGTFVDDRGVSTWSTWYLGPDKWDAPRWVDSDGDGRMDADLDADHDGRISRREVDRDDDGDIDGHDLDLDGDGKVTRDGDGWVPNIERQAVGLPVDHDGDPDTPDVPASEIVAHPTALTENALRREMRWPEDRTVS